MTTFLEFLNSRQPKPETLQHAARYCLAESTDDLPYDEMKSQVVEATHDAQKVDKLLQELESDPLALQNAACDLLNEAWKQPGGPERVAAAVDNAERSLPVFEVAIIAIAAMYFGYLTMTKGIKLEERTVEYLPDGTKRDTVRRTFYGPTGPLSAIGSLLS